MKKHFKISKLLFALLPLISLTGCNSTPTECEEHFDFDDDGYCEFCHQYIGKLLTFDDVVLKNATYTYDGNEHVLLCENVPSFAHVTYQNNKATYPGTYQVLAQIGAPGYITRNLYATLTINKARFSGITFNDADIIYDEEYHSIYVEGAPEFATVTYTNNNQKYEGEYEVVATVKANYYETLTLRAKMKISKKLPDAIIESRTLLYDGTYQYIMYELPNNLPRYTEVSYEVDGVKTTDINDLKVKTLGKHTVSVILTNERYNYLPSKATAEINVVKNNIGGVDSSKQPFIIDESLKFNELVSKIKEANFTVKLEVFDEFFYQNGSTKKTNSYTKDTYVTNNEVFSYLRYPESDANYDSVPESEYCHSKIVGDEVLTVNYEEGVISELDEPRKYPAAYYNENVVIETGLRAIQNTKESSDGGIEGYHQTYSVTTYGEPIIDVVNNKLMVEERTHYYRSEYNHDEISLYTIYNIGNTKIDMIDDLSVESIDSESFMKAGYYKDFFYYMGNRVDNLGVTNNKILYYGPGVYTMEAVVDGVTITEIFKGYYEKNLNHDLTGFTIKTHFNKRGEYVGEYASLGSISNASYLETVYSEKGAVVEYASNN